MAAERETLSLDALVLVVVDDEPDPLGHQSPDLRVPVSYGPSRAAGRAVRSSSSSPSTIPGM
jgi:hypothetical protein